jgi:hypothetical protein
VDGCVEKGAPTSLGMASDCPLSFGSEAAAWRRGQESFSFLSCTGTAPSYLGDVWHCSERVRVLVLAGHFPRATQVQRLRASGWVEGQIPGARVLFLTAESERLRQRTEQRDNPGPAWPALFPP